MVTEKSGTQAGKLELELELLAELQGVTLTGFSYYSSKERGGGWQEKVDMDQPVIIVPFPLYPSIELPECEADTVS